MHYVIGDVHGNYDEMMRLINKIESEDKEARFFFLGDFIDRGPQVDLVLEWCLVNITENGKYQSVRGNHEQMVLDWFYEEWIPWWEHGRGKGIAMPETKYDFSRWLDALYCDSEKPYLIPEDVKPYIHFFSSLPLSKKVTVRTINGKEQEYCIAHAFYDFTGDYEDSLEYVNLWKRAFLGNRKTEDILIHGHTPTIVMEYIRQDYGPSHPGMICYSKNDINIDGGCAYPHVYPHLPSYLCAIRLEDLEEIYSCSLEEHLLEKVNDAEVAAEHAKAYREKYLNQESRYRAELVKRVRECL